MKDAAALRSNLIAPPTDVAGVLVEWSRLAERAYSAHTLRAWKADWGVFSGWCERERKTALPAEALTVREFVLWGLAEKKKPATLQRYLATIARAHRAAGLSNPCASEVVRLALKEVRRTVPARQRQARGLGWAEIRKYLAVAPRHLRDHRDRALVCVAYDTLCRREELVALRVEDFAVGAEGAGEVLITRAKNDPGGEGAVAYLAPLTVRLLRTWLKAAGISEGPVFRRVDLAGFVREDLRPAAVAEVYRRIAKWIGLAPEEIARVSGHSTRVGATQDLLALNVELPAVMQAGRWRDTRMPMRYGERVLAGRGAMAQVAKKQGRT